MMLNAWLWYTIIYCSVGLAVWFAYVMLAINDIERDNDMTFWEALVIYFIDSLPLVKGIFMLIISVAIWPITVCEFILYIEGRMKDWANSKKVNAKETENV